MELLKKTGTKKTKLGCYHSYGIFKCQKCGKEIEKRLDLGRKQKTCGCGRHGLSYTRIYRRWYGIKERCFVKNNPLYKWYGDRGISVCDEWLEFIPFYEWAIKNGHSDSLELDRIDSDGDYEPSNCRFVTQEINGQNKRSVKLNIDAAREIKLIYQKSSLNMAEIGRLYNVSGSAVRDIIYGRTWRNS